MNERVHPTEIRVAKDRRTLSVTFSDGATHDYPAEYLRVESPSAEVQGHSASQRVTVPGKIDVGIMSVEPVGNYAVRITFDDLHSSGIFSWDYLIKLADERDEIWGKYLAALEAEGLSRERS